MKLKDFEKEFPPKIIRRGEEYYKDGAVTFLEQISENTYEAEVEGSDIYNVIIEMDSEGEIDYIDCDCPYDDEYCKHVAAVLYKLRDMSDKGRTVNKRGNITDMLKKCTREQLEAIISEHANEDRSFRDYLKMRLSESDDIKEYIDSFSRMAELYFQERCTIDILNNAAEILLDKADKKNDPLVMVEACRSVISVFTDKMENAYPEPCDSYDFDEQLESCSQRVSAECEKAAACGDMELIERLWKELIQDRDNEFRFFEALLKFACIPEYRTELENELLRKRAAVSEEYMAERIDDLRFRIIKEYGTKKEEELFIEEHLSYPEYRMMAIDNAIEAGEFQKAEKLAIEGELHDKDHFGLINEWLRKRYDIYSLTNDTSKLEEVCRSLVINGQTEYYSRWKELLTPERAEQSIKQLLSVKTNRSYEYIAAYENRSDMIYRLCCDSPHKITMYYKKLRGTEYENKAFLLYEKYLRKCISDSSTRAEYYRFCCQLKCFEKDCGKERADTLAQEFRREYTRRPAFLDELSKAGF